MPFTRSLQVGLMIGGALAFAPELRADAKCAEQIETVAGKSAMLLPSCMINLPGISNSTQSRSYVISPNGQFMIFNSFGHSGRNSTDTGSRSYFLFPIRQKPSLEKNPINGEIVARTASGQAIQIGKDGRIIGMTGAKFKEDPRISGTNRGGVEMTYFDGILLDAGWATGGQAFEKRNGSSTFRDRHGTACTVPNAKIFVYSSRYHVQVAFHSNDALGRFLKAECPRLDLAPLFARSVSGSGESDAGNPAAGAAR